MNIKKIILVTILLLPFFSTVNAQVDEIDESEFEEFDILCPNKVDRRTLSFNSEKSLWCDSTVIDFCKPEKVKAAYHVCTKRYALKLKKLSALPNQNRVNLSSLDLLKMSVVESGERLKLEQELLDIKQKLLDIKRKKVELEKEVVRLNAISSS